MHSNPAHAAVNAWFGQQAPPGPPLGMAVDSEAVFEQRVRELKLGEKIGHVPLQQRWPFSSDL